MPTRPIRLLGVLLTVATVASAGVVEDWNQAFLQAVRKETPPPCLVSRNLPIFHLAMHRAVRDGVRAGLPETALEKAASQAATTVFLSFFPSQTKLATPLQPAPADGDPALWREIGASAARRTLKEREDDGASTTVHYVPKAEPGQWRRTPPNFRPPEFPHWGQVRPFVIDHPAAFRAPPPPRLTSAEYADEINQLHAIGGKISRQRTDEQTLIARFWADFSYTSSPPGHWNEIAREVSRQRRLPVTESARLFAQLNLALADTCISIWDTKYHYNFWRPVTAIRQADQDSNATTTADPAWEPLLRTPPHPEYVSGHSGISGAAATILEHWFGTENIRFEASSDDVPDQKRAFTSFQACAEEISRSRIYGGIHFPAAGREGLNLGRRVARHVLTHFRD